MQFSIQKCRFENVNMALLCKKLATGPRSNQVDIIQCGQILNTCTTLAAFWPKLNAISKKIFNLKSFFMLFNWQKDYFKPNSNTKHDLDSKYNALIPLKKPISCTLFLFWAKFFQIILSHWNHSLGANWRRSTWIARHIDWIWRFSLDDFELCRANFD